MSLDSDSCIALLAADLRRRGVLSTWADLLQPVLTGLDERRRASGTGIEVDQLLGESAEVALRTAVRARTPRPGVRPVLLSALEPDDHRLSLVAAGAALSEQGVPVRMLGVRLPWRALSDAVARTGPAAVLVWSQGGRHHGVPGEPLRLAPVRPRPAVVLGGPGWEGRKWDGDATRAANLPDAVALLVAATAAGGDQR